MNKQSDKQTLATGAELTPDVFEEFRQQVKVGGAYLVSGGSSRPVWEWVDEGSERDREHQWRKHLEQMRASTQEERV